MKNKRYVPAALIFALLFTGCGKSASVMQGAAFGDTEAHRETEIRAGAETGREEALEELESESAESGQPEESAESKQPEILNFVDVYGETYQAEINSAAAKHDYHLEAFSRQGDALAYVGDERYTYRLGLDVSHYQGMIDWQKVKEAGFEFAFLRIGYRGYGQAGNLHMDNRFFANIEDAQAAGMDVGVYFFSQAVDEEEAEEEAEFVLEALSGYKLQLPIVYDPESVLDDKARTDEVTGEQFTKNTIAFCSRIKEAGFEPMIYCNMLWEAYQLNLEQLSEYPVWYADYEALPQTPYQFSFWQYTNTGTVDGITGDVDLDVQLIPAGE